MKFLLHVMFITTLSLLTALSTKVEALTIADGSPAKLFDQVQITSSQNVAVALGDLFNAPDRACLLYPLGDDYTAERRGVKDSADRTTEVMLLLAARDFSVTAGQMLGSAEGEPGVLEIKDRVLAAILGSDLGFPGQSVKVLPSAGAIIQLEKQDEGETEIVARQAWSQILKIRAGSAIL